MPRTKSCITFCALWARTDLFLSRSSVVWQILSSGNQNPTRLSNKTSNDDLVRRIRLWRIKLSEKWFKYLYWTMSKIFSVNLFTCKWTWMNDWVGRHRKRRVWKGEQRQRRSNSRFGHSCLLWNPNASARLDICDVTNKATHTQGKAWGEYAWRELYCRTLEGRERKTQGIHCF